MVSGFEGFEMVGSPLLSGTQNGELDNESVQFSSDDEELKGEGSNVLDADLPRDPVDEWPVPQEIRTFYFVKYRLYEDPLIKAKMDQADRELKRKNQARFQISEDIKAKRAERAQLIAQLKPLRNEDRQFRTVLNEKAKELKPLQFALGTSRNTNGASWGGVICSSEEELDALIDGLQYRIQHESIALAEEKQLLREIKQLEGTRDKVIASAAARTKIEESMGPEEVIQEQVKLIGNDLNGARKAQLALSKMIKTLSNEVEALNKEIDSLSEELVAVTKKRDEVYDTIRQLRSEIDDGNISFFNSRKIITKAKNLAVNKDIEGLEELYEAEVENFMSLWSSNKNFRKDYEKRVLQSLDARQLSRDGRIRNPDEKAIALSDGLQPSNLDTGGKVNAKRSKADQKSSEQKTLPIKKPQKAKQKVTESKTDLEDSDVDDKKRQGMKSELEHSEIPGSEKAKEELSSNGEIDAEKLKQMKREEEIAKAKLAMERKKKLAEKAAVKATKRAQKEAEKKQKEREKKAKKKAAAPEAAANLEEINEADAKASEPEKVEVNTEAPFPTKEKVPKEKTPRHRHRSRTIGRPSVLKALSRRKKSSNYWKWAVPVAASVVVVVFVLLGYHYLIQINI